MSDIDNTEPTPVPHRTDAEGLKAHYDMTIRKVTDGRIIVRYVQDGHEIYFTGN